MIIRSDKRHAAVYDVLIEFKFVRNEREITSTSRRTDLG